MAFSVKMTVAGGADQNGNEKAGFFYPAAELATRFDTVEWRGKLFLKEPIQGYEVLAAWIDNGWSSNELQLTLAFEAEDGSYIPVTEEDLKLEFISFRLNPKTNYKSAQVKIEDVLYVFNWTTTKAGQDTISVFRPDVTRNKRSTLARTGERPS